MATSEVSTQAKVDASRTMPALEWLGAKFVAVTSKPVPLVTNKHDAVLKVTSTAICGSDLHLYLGYMPGMQKHDTMGHEFMGIVESVGPDVKSVKPGDRVVACFDIACGHCSQCKSQLYSECNITNSSEELEQMMGHRSGGFFGYSHLTGGYAGGQAGYARVPFADVNLLKVPNNLSDRQVILLSDVLCTAWHATELGDVHKGDVVAIWGAGPVGILAAHCAQYRGAKRVIIIDNIKYRLNLAKSKLGIETVNFDEVDTLKRLKELVPEGPDVCIEAVGFHYNKTYLSRAETAVGLQTDTADVLNECIVACKKGGRISVVGVYAGSCNHFMIGALMEKGLTMRLGQCPCQKYWEKLLSLIQSGDLDPTIVITHEPELSKAPEAYKIFNDKLDNCVKVVMHPKH